MAQQLNRRDLLHLAAAPVLPGIDGAAESLSRSFWLFKLLDFANLVVTPVGTTRLHCSEPARQWIVEGQETLDIGLTSPAVHITGPSGRSVWCTIEIPDQISREFFGTVDVRSIEGSLAVTLTTPIEVATNCVVGAEMPIAIAHPEALAAQAIVSRSIIFATPVPRHSFAQFCDTTHCQFFRSPAPPGSAAATAVRRTAHLVMVQNGRAISPRYCGACGGRTQSGFDNGAHYSSVVCEPCAQRGTAPRGHGWGLCQEGAMALARGGSGYWAILRKYYPDMAVCMI